MGFTLVNEEGSGAVKPDSIANYSYSEDVTSLEPSSISGGTSQVNVTAISIDEDTLDDKHPNSNLLINNTMTLTDSRRGSVQFQVKQLNNSNGVVSITGDTVMARLNATKTAEPHGGTGYTILSAIEYYCGLVGVTPSIDTEFAAELELIEVNFIGWTGNVWEHLKMLCAGVSASETDNVGIEMYIDQDVLVFRKAKTVIVDFTGRIAGETVAINSFEASSRIDVANYNTSYGINKNVQEQNRSGTLYAANEDVSITDTMQVEPGQTMSKRFKINATLESVEQPVCVEAIFPLPYTGSTGQYVVVGSDDLPIDPDQWVGQGGDLRVVLTENPDEIEIQITAPPLPSLKTAADPMKVTYAPYKIGIENGDEADYPALYVVGTGVFFKKSNKTFITGASSDYTSKTSVTSVDNPFITNALNQSMRGIAAAQAACGPVISLNQTVDTYTSFGETPGSVQFSKSNKFRIVNASYGPTAVSTMSSPCASFTDFNSNATTKTFANFTAKAFNPAINPDNALKFNEFSVIPLMEV